METQSKVQIRGQNLLIDGQVISYSDQILHEDHLYLVDLGKNIQLDPVISEYDTIFFRHTLKNALISQLELVDASLAFQLFKNLVPQIEEWLLKQLFRNLRLTKLQKILGHHDCFMFLWERCYIIINKTQPTFIIKQKASLFFKKWEQSPLGNIIFLLESFPRESKSQLRKTIQQTARLIVLNQLSSKKFMEKITFDSSQTRDDSQDQTKKLPSKHFLTNLYNIATSLYILVPPAGQLLSFQTANEHNQISLKIDQSLIGSLLTEECLAVVIKHFWHFFLTERQQLMKIYHLFSMHYGTAFWQKILENNIKIEQKDDDQNEQLTSLKVFSRHMIHNYYSGGQQWTSSVYLLTDLLRHQTQGHHILQEIIAELIPQLLTVEHIDLIKALCDSTAQRGHIDQDLQKLLELIFNHITLKIQFFYCKNQQEKKQLARPKISTLLICALLRLFNALFNSQLILKLRNFDYSQPVCMLLMMTQNKKGLVEGSRRALFSSILVFLQSKHLQSTSLIQTGFLSQKYQFRKLAVTQEASKSPLEKLSTFVKEIMQGKFSS